ncbi:MAG: hypothetical protein EPN72_01335 [Nevskiaceae bacterium]|nr:MAG: hypothetical protein EPN63_12085 [Nevskiaceae bacterium]TBR74695.1 MAG: hypothetical protein EPN72_01335 [Nevskiaceae bacterium]
MTFATVARSLGVAFLAASLAACGGGSGFGPATGTGGTTPPGTTSPGGSNPPATSATVSTPELMDASNVQVGTTANPITDANPAIVRVTLSGVPDPTNQVITFELIGAPGVGALDPVTGTALTDSNGVALITLKSGTAQGAATLKASYAVGSASATSQQGFTTLGAGQSVQLQLALGSGSGGSFTPGVITAPAGLVSGSTASVSVNVVDTGNGNAVYTDAPVQVTFTSACLQGGSASFNPVTATTISGSALTSYQPANGCTNDTISASAIVNGKTLTAATPSFAVPQSPANAIQFVSAVPDKIGVKGASGAGTAEASILTFLISDQNGNPVGPGVGVTFTVQTPVGGFGIANGTASVVNTQTAQTDNSGKVSVTVNSGTVPMIGTIKATLTATPTIFGTGSVAVQQGVATEDRFVIAVATLNPAAGNHVGVTDNVVVRAADRVGNWVPDGTIIHFETKLGDIGASCTTVNGTCSVTWTSQASQPLLFDVNRATSGCSAFTLDELFRHGLPSQPWDMQCGKHDRYGVNVITAWTTGEESFSDTNGNNVFDNGEPFVDLGESFNDNNLNGIHDPTNGAFSEDYQDLDTNGTYDGPNGLYNGLACPAGATNCQRSLIDVRRGTTMVLSTDSIQMRVWDGSSVPVDLAISNPTAWGTGILTSATPEATQLTSASSAITAAVADLNGNAPAIGTSISVTVTKIDPSSKAAVVGPSTCTIGNAVDHMECVFSINPGLAGDKFTITATSGADANIAVSRTLTVQ